MRLLVSSVRDIIHGPSERRIQAIGAIVMCFAAGAFALSTIEHHVPQINVLGLPDAVVALVGGLAAATATAFKMN